MEMILLSLLMLRKSKMQELKSFNQSDLVLQIKKNYDIAQLDIDEWDLFLDRLCGDRIYQKDAIKTAIIYLASGQYNSLKDLAIDNYRHNNSLKDKYQSFEEFSRCIQLGEKLYATIDLATGTGKSYVIYGIAQIALGIGLVTRVLVLCPSLTIESGLRKKFFELSGNEKLKESIPANAKIKNPSVISANETVKEGCLCIENIHAVYENTGSSIRDSFCGSGNNTLILNDEAHHIFNNKENKDATIKKWKTFLLDSEYSFKYMLGFTGTAYIGDDYFPDVIYRYSLRQAIEDKIVKNIDYVKEDESKSDYERYQKIYQNHLTNKQKYQLLKPLSILITRDIGTAKRLTDDFINFLVSFEKKSRADIESKVLIVTSANEHKANVAKLSLVDDEDNPIEWIISVSMLTEGWDVKNVFQIVPCEERAFNSKLLISQVLGRGLRLPLEYQNPQPTVIVFNHKAWSSNIKRLVEEVLEIETRVQSCVLQEGSRSQYNFSVHNLNYRREQTEIDKARETESFDFSRLASEGIALESQTVETVQGTTYESILGNNIQERNYSIRNNTWTIEDVVDRIYEEFEIRDWEAKILKIGEAEYTKTNLPPKELIENIIRKSMEQRGNNGEEIIESNVNKILSAFTPLLRKNSKSVSSKPVSDALYEISTSKMDRQSISISMLRQERTVFVSDNWEDEISDDSQKSIISGIFDEDSDLPRSASRIIPYSLFKTPVSTVLTVSRPERKFVEMLCKKENAKLISAWVKSRDQGFYEIEYSLRYGSKNSKTRKYHHDTFNPDFFIKISQDNMLYFLVIEIKEDGDDSDVNKAKYKYAVQHFDELNAKLSEHNINEKYIFHFLSPESYDNFFHHLKECSLLRDQSTFRCKLENMLEEAALE